MGVYRLGKTANAERNDRAANASSPSQGKIDVGRYVAEMERILRADNAASTLERTGHMDFATDHFPGRAPIQVA